MLTPSFISDRWPLTDIALGPAFQTYPTRRVVQIASAQGMFVAKIDDQPPAYELAARALAVFDYLAERSFAHIPALLRTRDGQPLAHTGAQSVTLMEYLGGEAPRATAATWAELGAIARALNAHRDYPHDYAIETAGAIAELSEQARSHPQRERFELFISWLAPLLQASSDGLVHGEINLANAARRSDGTLALLDWDEAGTGPTVVEIGYPLIVVFLGEDLHFRHDLASAFYHGYYAGRAPGADERERVFLAALLHALRSMRFANQQRRWERVCYAAAHRQRLLAALP